MAPVPALPKKDWGKYWEQIKDLKRKQIIRLLDKDPRWEFVKVRGSHYVYYNAELPSPHNYVEISHHAGGYGDKSLLKMLLDNICWDIAVLKKWKVIKKKT